MSLFIRVLISYTMTPFLINRLGGEYYGVWSLLLTFTMAGALSFFSFGFQGALVKYVAEYHILGKTRELSEVFSATFLFLVVIAVVCALMLLALSFFFIDGFFNIPSKLLPDARVVLLVFALMVLFDLPSMAISAIVEGVQRYDLIAILDVCRISAFAFAAFLILKEGEGLVPLSLALTGSSAFYMVGMAICAKKQVPYVNLVVSFNLKEMRNLFTLTLDILILRFNGVIYNNMDKLIVGMVLGAALVTDYDIANRVHALALTVMGLAPSVVLPAASAYGASNDDERLRKLLLKGSKYTTAMTVSIVVVLFVLAEPLISFWISPDRAYVAQYAQLFLVYLFFWPVIQVGWNMLVGVAKVKSIIPIQTASVIVNLLLSIILIHFIGVAGVMIATLVANAMIFFAYVKLISKTFGISIAYFLRQVVFAAYLISALVGGALFAVVRFRPPKSLIEVGLYGLVAIFTLVALYLVGSIDQEDKNRIFEFTRRFS